VIFEADQILPTYIIHYTTGTRTAHGGMAFPFGLGGF
jgi:hypothetical protein